MQARQRNRDSFLGFQSKMASYHCFSSSKSSKRLLSQNKCKRNLTRITNPGVKRISQKVMFDATPEQVNRKHCQIAQYRTYQQNIQKGGEWNRKSDSFLKSSNSQKSLRYTKLLHNQIKCVEISIAPAEKASKRRYWHSKSFCKPPTDGYNLSLDNHVDNNITVIAHLIG